MPDPTSLDALLQKIQSDTDLTLSQITSSPGVSGSNSSAVASGQANPLGVGGGDVGDRAASALRAAPVDPNLTAGAQERSTNEIWETNLTPRQQTLPKISANMLGGIVAIFVMMVGVGAATTLSQRSQDIRQDASGGDATLSGTAATLTSAEYELQSGVQTEGETFTWSDPQNWTMAQWAILAGGGVVLVALFGALWWILREE